MCVTCKLNLFPGKYLKLLAEIVFTIKGPRRKRQKKTVGSSLDLFFPACPLRAYCHHSGSLGQVLAPVQIPLDL